MKVIMAFLFLSLLLSACSRHTTKAQQQIVGTWVPTNGCKLTLTFNPDSIYSYTNAFPHPPHTNVFSGEWPIAADNLISTCTNAIGPEPYEPVRQVDYYKIIRLGDNELTVEFTGELFAPPNTFLYTFVRRNNYSKPKPISSANFFAVCAAFPRTFTA
jgi:hypothetical protein